MRILIEKITKKDLPMFYSLFKKAILEDFREYSPEVASFQLKRHRKSNLLRWIRQGDEYVFLAKNEKGDIAGILVAQKIIGGVSNCDWLIVPKEFRRQGVGTRLLGHWESWIRRNKGHLLAVTCARRNCRFYQRAGYKKYGYIHEGYFGNCDYLLFKRIGEWNKKSLAPRKNA